MTDRKPPTIQPTDTVHLDPLDKEILETLKWRSHSTSMVAYTVNKVDTFSDPWARPAPSHNTVLRRLTAFANRV